MKKLFVLPLLLCALLLGGCANKNAARFEEFSAALGERNDLDVTAEVRAEYDDRSCTFTLRCVEDGSGGCTVEVLAPELIRGVRARMSADGTKLVYDSVSVDTGDDGSAALSPMGALPLLLRALRTASLDAAWKEDGKLAVQLTPEDGVSMTVLFDDETRPSCAEIARDGTALLFIDITDFS